MRGYLLTGMICATGFLAGCTATDRRLETEVGGYSGDGTARFVSRPGLLGCPGVIIELGEVDGAADAPRIFTLNEVPVGDGEHPYTLYLTPKVQANVDRLEEATVMTKLQDDTGNTLWEVGAAIKEWVHAEAGDTSSFHYWRPQGTELVECGFMAARGRTYTLTLDYKRPPAAASDDAAQWAMAVTLESGGYK